VQIDCSCNCVRCVIVAGEAVTLGIPTLCEVIVPDVRHCWYASWMKGRRLMHIWLPSGFRSQSSMLRWYRPHCAMRSKAFWRSCCVVYGFHARVAISWQPVHYLNRISGGSCGLYTAKNVRLFWRIVFGVGFPYVVAS
jgi:hypothetical protein